MPIQVSLLKNKQVILYEYSDPINIIDLETALSCYCAAYESGCRPIYSIFNVSQLAYFPKIAIDTLQTSHRRPYSLLRNRATETNIIVTAEKYVVLMASLTNGLALNCRIEVVKSMNEVWAKINELMIAQDASSRDPHRIAIGDAHLGSVSFIGMKGNG